MRYLPYILASVAALLCACSETRGINAGADPKQQAEWIVSSGHPEEAARKIVVWLEQADTADRMFSKHLVSQILFYYDSIGATDSASRFVSEFDSRCAQLDLPRKAKVMLALDTPQKLGALLARQPQSDSLAAAVEDELSLNPQALEAFRNAYEQYDKYYNKLRHENDSTIR